MAERMQWVFSDPCGCPFGVLEGGRIDSEAVAFFEFYELASDVRKALNRGVTAERMPHAEYVAKMMPRMRTDFVCPHGPRGVS